MKEEILRAIEFEEKYKSLRTSQSMWLRALYFACYPDPLKESMKIENGIKGDIGEQGSNKKGVWQKSHKDSSRYKCSVCGKINNMLYILDKFCCNCGADMRGEKDDER